MKQYLSLIAFVAMVWCGGSPAACAEELVIGVLGTMSGPTAQLGLINRYCAEVTAAMYNEAGGIEIGGKRYKIRVVVRDDELNPAKAVQGARDLIKQGAHYIIGPNLDDSAQAIVPVLETANAMNISYGVDPLLVKPPRSNTILGMAAAFQSIPVIYRYLRDQKKVRNVALLPNFAQRSLQQRNVAERAAREMGLQIRQIDTFDLDETVYGPHLAGARAALHRLVPLHPDFILLPGALRGELPELIGLIRQAGYSGLMGVNLAEEPAQLAKMGKAANGFIYVGGNPPESSWSEYKKEFARRYRVLAGEWHDEAGTKAYALETLLRTLQVAGSAAITDIAVFKLAMEDFAVPDPFLKTPRTLRYVGRDSFGQSRQIDVPLIINAVRDGGVETVYLGELPR
jgi:branched-chain amino acid transport system substrate-binding protein